MNYQTLEIGIMNQVGTVFFNRQNDLDNQILRQLVAELQVIIWKKDERVLSLAT